jgi:hypothetical protein
VNKIYIIIIVHIKKRTLEDPFFLLFYYSQTYLIKVISTAQKSQKLMMIVKAILLSDLTIAVPKMAH